MHALFSCAYLNSFVSCALASTVSHRFSNAILTFEPPVLIANDVDEFSDMVFTLTHAAGSIPDSLIAFGSSSFSISNDGGSTWAAVPVNPTCTALGGFDGVPHRVTPTMLRNYGNVTANVPFGRDYYNFSSSESTSFSSVGSKLQCETENRTIVFAGLPRAVTCSKFTCSLRLHGGATTKLPDGTYLYSAIVFWGGGMPNATSLVAFSSPDGAAWSYVGTIADASNFPLSQEGPNENAITVLSDNKTVACVFRLDAGDGPETHPYANYALATSVDNGATWVARGSLPNAGCARPKLLHLGKAPGGGVAAAAPLLLTGGRWRTYGNTSDILMWVNADGMATNWSAGISISAIHNSLVKKPDYRFSPAVNATSGPRETTSYTSVMELDQGISTVGNVSTRRIGITYNRHPLGGIVPPMTFFMAFTVKWD